MGDKIRKSLPERAKGKLIRNENFLGWYKYFMSHFG
jgi:hypothetical protein